MRGNGAPDPAVSALSDLGMVDTLEEARVRFRACAEWEATFRKKFMEDVRFAEGDSFNGYQWPEDIRRTRDLSDKPCLTLNVVRQHNLKIINDMRRQKQSARILGMGNGATQDSANIMKQIIRHIEYISKAQRNAYTPARNSMVKGGIGWWRLITDYVDNESFDQEIYIEGIPDALSVFMDPDCQNPDCSDGRYAFVFSFLPKELVTAIVPDYPWNLGAPRMPIGIAPGESFFIEKDHWMVCEYFRKVPVSDRLISFMNMGQRLTIRESLLPPEAVSELLSRDNVMTRRVVDQQVQWKLIVGDEIVDETIWPGMYIPLVRCLGEEVVLGGVLDRKGHTRALVDAQRMFNYNALLDLRTRVPTPFGWTTVGDLNEGDWVFSADGIPVRVKEALPIHYDEECFRINFSDGHSIVTDAGHIWRVEERVKRVASGFIWEDVTICTVELEPNKHFINLTKPLELPLAKLPLDPYLLGVWLGDGHSGSGTISAHVDDAEEEKELIRELGYSVGESRGFHGNGCEFGIFNIVGKLKDMGLLNNKYIPVEYRRASAEQRLALLQGLMDTDGHYHEAVNQCIFINKSELIIDGFVELCASLGIKVAVKNIAEKGKYIKGLRVHSKSTIECNLVLIQALLYLD